MNLIEKYKDAEVIDDVDLYLEDLKSKFSKINSKEYYLSYSGGKDSHLLYWFIKEYAHIEDIEIVGVNTYMEHHEILARIKKNCDVILYPKLKPFEIKERYGIPCFTKQQDEYIKRYQTQTRTPFLMKMITGLDENGKPFKSYFKLNKTARDLLLTNKLHKVSPMCCTMLKKQTVHLYEKSSGKKAIMGVRANESKMRKAMYSSCFTKDLKFTPLWDLSDELLDKIYQKYNIEIPSVYKYINRTGCMGCPYGKDPQLELSLVSPQQRKFVTRYFKESYEVLGIEVDS